MKDFIKRKKYILLIGFSLLILLIIMFFAVKDLFFTTGKDNYGDRLDGIENYPINDDKQSDVINTLKENDIVNSVSIDIKGRIINIIIDVNDGVSVNDAKALSLKALEKFSSDELGYYDVQFYLTESANESEDNKFPIMGSKSAKSDVVSWIKE